MNEISTVRLLPVVEGFHFSLTMHPRHVKVPVMNWVLKVGPTGFVWRVNLLNSGGLLMTNVQYVPYISRKTKYEYVSST